MIIAVSGVPGTGKSTVAKFIANEFDLQYVDAGALIQKNKKRYEWDAKRRSVALTPSEFTTLLRPHLRKGNVVVDSLLSHFLPPRLVDVCVITNCDQKTLLERLTKRGWSEPKKQENLLALNFEVCLLEAREKGHRVVVWDTVKHVKTVWKKVRKSIERSSK